MLISSLSDKRKVHSILCGLEEILDERELLSNYLLWENLLSYYIINDEYKRVRKIATKIVRAINGLDEEYNKKNEFEYLTNDGIITVRKSLTIHFEGCLARNLALIWGREIADIVKEILNLLKLISDDTKTYSAFVKLRKQYVMSRMINQSLVPVTLNLLVKTYSFSDKRSLDRLYCLEDLFSKKIRHSRKRYYFLPYVVTPFDIGYSLLIDDLIQGTGTISSPAQMAQRIMKEYATQFDNDWTGLDRVIKISRERIIVDSEKASSINVAVTNVNMHEKDIWDALKRKKRNRTKRYNELVSLANYAILHHSDVLVFPEAYVPIKFLRGLGDKSADNQMLIICGLEHVVHNDYVWNLTCTIIPFEFNGVKYSIPLFRQKKYSSPKEMSLYKDLSLTAPAALPNVLYNWKQINFASYCCYDLTNILDRGEFKGKIDVFFGIEWNQDVGYFSNIVESLSRDMYCYCVQANVSEYGDSRIVQPSKSYKKNIIQIKGGKNATVIIGEVDIGFLLELRKDSHLRKTNDFSELPAGM